MFANSKKVTTFAPAIEREILDKKDGPFVYRLGRKIFILERGVRFPHGLPNKKAIDKSMAFLFGSPALCRVCRYKGSVIILGGLIWLSGNFWLLSFKISYLCLPLFYETRTTPSCHPSGCAYRQL